MLNKKFTEDYKASLQRDCILPPLSPIVFEAFPIKSICYWKKPRGIGKSGTNLECPGRRGTLKVFSITYFT